MIRGNTVGLRARHESDVAVLQAELYDDVETRSRADNRPWRPIAPGSSRSPYAVADPSDDAACFSVVLLGGDGDGAGELAGEALLWAIDTHNRSAHIGISLRPAFRGRGMGTETVQVLCHYGFVVRGLHRMQIETLAGNTAMIRLPLGRVSNWRARSAAPRGLAGRSPTRSSSAGSPLADPIATIAIDGDVSEVGPASAVL
jgi:RimJ/RimL family protein N-acetyltransferase